MISSEREIKILELLAHKGVISIKDTAKIIGVSEITIRRDFDRLEKKGKLKKVSGGATSNRSNNYRAELTSRTKQSLNEKEKKLVAEYATSLVDNGDCIFIDSGSTMIFFVEKLLDKNITIITNNNFIPQIVNNTTRAEIFVIGGKLLSEFNMNVGPLVVEQLKAFHFTKSFLGCSGLNLTSGNVYTSVLESYNITNYLLNNCELNYLLIDASKLTKTSVIRFADISQFTKIICNDDSLIQPEKFPNNFQMIDPLNYE